MKFPKTGVRAMEGENATVERRNARADGEDIWRGTRADPGQDLGKNFLCQDTRAWKELDRA